MLIRAYNQTLRIAQELVSETGAVATDDANPNRRHDPQNTEGDQYLSLAITPTNALSTLIIDVVAYSGVERRPDRHDGRTVPRQHGQCPGGRSADPADRRLRAAGDLPAFHGGRHTSATTFKVRAGGGGASTTTFNGSGGARLLGGVYASSITIRERLPAS